MKELQQAIVASSAEMASDVVVVGASAGGLPAMRKLALGLPADFSVPVILMMAETGRPEQIEKWHQPTGRWIHSSTARVGGPGSRRLVSVFYDITERKLAEARLRRAE